MCPNSSPSVYANWRGNKAKTSIRSSRRRCAGISMMRPSPIWNLLMWALGVAMAFRAGAALPLVAGLGVLLSRRASAEEHDLRRAFGGAWLRYRATTRQLIPLIY